MRVELLIVLTLMMAAIFIVAVLSIGLVLLKVVNARRNRQRQHAYEAYSNQIVEAMLAEVPDVPPTAPPSSRYSRYDFLVLPIRDELNALSPRHRRLHVVALRDVLVDFARDISGEASERVRYFFYALGFVDSEIERLRSRKWWIRAQSAHDLGMLRTRRAAAALTVALDDHHPDVRAEAMKSIVKLMGLDALPTILEHLHRMSDWTAVEFSRIVMEFRDEAVPHLIKGLESNDQSVVLFCIEMLSEIGFTTAVEPLRVLAANYPNSTIRAKAVEALGWLGDERAESLLLDLASGLHPHLRLKAIEAIGRIGIPRAIPVLTDCVRQGRFQEKLTAARSLAALGPEGSRALQELSRNSPDDVRAISEQVLDEVAA